MNTLLFETSSRAPIARILVDALRQLGPSDGGEPPVVRRDREDVEEPFGSDGVVDLEVRAAQLCGLKNR